MKNTILISAIVVCVLFAGTAAVFAMQKEVQITFADGEKEPIVSKGFHSTLEDVLQSSDHDVEQIKKDYHPNVAWDQPLENGAKIQLSCKCNVTVIKGGKKLGTFTTTQATVGEFLKERKIEMGIWDEPSASIDEPIEQGMTITIDEIQQVVEKKIEEVPYETEKIDDSELEKGKEEVVTEGEEGKKIYQITTLYKNGKPLMKDGKKAVTKKLMKEIKPVKEEIKIGTKEVEEEEEKEIAEAPSTDVPSTAGENYTATCYLATGNPTATGTTPSKGTIAVDPKVIPLGTRMYVDGYGYGIAEDTGGVIKGKKIDLFFENAQQCTNWGVKQVKVRILG